MLLRSPLFLSQILCPKPRVKLSFLRSETSAWVSPISWIPELPNHSLPFSPSILYYTTVQICCKEMTFLNGSCIISNCRNVERIQRDKMRLLIQCQRTFAIKLNLRWHVFFFWEECLAFLWSIKKFWKLRTQDWRMYWISTVNFWEVIEWQAVTIS